MSKLMEGKNCIVTGANSGIGKETALKLAKLGATVVMLCRDQTKGEKAMEHIKLESGNNSIDLILADLSSQQSIRKFVSEYKKKYDSLHVLVNNAGVNLNRRNITEDGVEMTFAVNVLAPFMLTNLFLEILKASAPARVVNVASKMQMNVNIDNLQGEKSFSGWKSYGQSKSALIMLTYEFARRYNNIGLTFNCLHPGAANTNIAKNLKGITGSLSRAFMKLSKSPEEGAATSIFLATSPSVEEVSGKYFENKIEAKSKDVTYDETIANQLWDACMELAGINSGKSISN
jgi:NAD(P)-dependent dehydrogenase (short-subunit alcohol dehydrogenase family)